MRRLWLALGVAGLAGLLVWANLRQVRPAAGAALAVRTLPLVPRDLAEQVLAPATLDVAQEVEVRARAGGPALAVLIRPGDEVAAGQVLARVDPADLAAAVEQAQSSLAQARATAAKLRRDADLAPRQMDLRLQAAALAVQQAEAALAGARSGAASQQAQARQRLAQARAGLEGVRARAAAGQATPAELAAALQQVAAAEAELAGLDPARSPQVIEAELRLASARQGLAQARVEAEAALVLPEQVEAAAAAARAAAGALAEARERLAAAEIRAPVAGTVLAVPVRDGQPVQPGALVAVLGRTDRLVARVRVDEVEIGKIRPGQAVIVTAPAYPGEKFPGQVARVDPRGTRAAQGTTTVYEVEVEVENSGGRLRAGMNVDGEITAAVHRGVLAVPLEAVQEEGEGRHIWVVAGGAARRRPVTPGAQAGGDVVLAAGAAAGDEVVVGPAPVLKELKEGQQVKPEARQP